MQAYAPLDTDKRKCTPDPGSKRECSPWGFLFPVAWRFLDWRYLNLQVADRRLTKSPLFHVWEWETRLKRLRKLVASFSSARVGLAGKAPWMNRRENRNGRLPEIRSRQDCTVTPSASDSYPVGVHSPFHRCEGRTPLPLAAHCSQTVDSFAQGQDGANKLTALKTEAVSTR